MINTKQLFAVLSITAMSFAMPSCSKDNQDFTINENEIQTVWSNPNKISKEDFLSKISGKAWKWVSSNEIKEDGSVDFSRGYYDELLGGGPSDYYFDDNYYLNYYHDLSMGLGPVFRKSNSEYDDETSTIYWVDKDGKRGQADFVILKADSQHLIVKEYMALRSTGKGDNDLQPIYAISVYKRMSSSEYSTMKKEYRDFEEAEKEHNEKYRQ